MKKTIIISLISLFTIGLVLGIVFFQKGVKQGAKLGGVEKLIEPEITPQPEAYQVQIPESKEECLAEIGSYSPKELMGAINFLVVGLPQTEEKIKELYESIFAPFLDTIICQALINQTKDNYLMTKSVIENQFFFERGTENQFFFEKDTKKSLLILLDTTFCAFCVRKTDILEGKIAPQHDPLFKLYFYSQEKICPKGKESPGIKEEWLEYAKFKKIDISKEKPADFFDNYCAYLDKYKKDKKAFEKEVLGSEGEERVLFSPRFARILAWRLAGENEAVKLCPECTEGLKKILEFKAENWMPILKILKECELASINDDGKLEERLNKIKNLICEIRAESAPKN